MIKKKIINPDRIRRINGGFSFIPHRFVCDGFLASLQQKELLVYLFLVTVSDRHGLSFYYRRKPKRAFAQRLFISQHGKALTRHGIYRLADAAGSRIYVIRFDIQTDSSSNAK
jgi:hypothetical protein